MSDSPFVFAAGFSPENSTAGPLADDAVDLWCASADQPPAIFETLYASLDTAERARAAEFVFEKDRTTYVTARGLLRHLLARYTSQAPTDIRFSVVGNGKPVLTDPASQTAPLHFNISHSGRRVLLGFTRLAEIGVDIEHASRPIADLLEIAERFFAPGEFHALRELPPDQLQRGFFNCWTRKEAFIKVYGEGLSRDLNTFEVELRPGEAARLLIVDGSLEKAARFALHALEPDAGYVAAFCLPARPGQIRCFHFQGPLDGNF